MKLSIRKPLRKGTLVYHGTSAMERFTELRGPAWVSDAETVAREFTTWNQGGGPPRVLAFKIIEAPRLIIISEETDMRNLSHWVEQKLGEEAEPGVFELAEQVCRVSGVDGWHVPSNYPSGSDTMICEPDRSLELVEEYEL